MNLEERAKAFATEAHAGQVVKRCCGCKSDKPLIDFNKSKSGKYGLHNHCRACQASAKRRFYVANRPSEIEKSRTRAKSDLGRAQRKDHYDLNKDQMLEKNRRLRKTPSARRKAGVARLAREARNPSVKIARNLRVRLRKAMIGINRSQDTFDLLGCDLATLKSHLEAQFRPGMTWENYGYRGWHMDHIKPCSSFDLHDPIQQAKCFNYRNIQPLWRAENQSKGDRLRFGAKVIIDWYLTRMSREG